MHLIPSTPTLLLFFLTFHPSLQTGGYNPRGFSSYNDLRSCVQFCVDPGIIGLGCYTNDCMCRADILSQAVSAVSTCAVTSCNNGNDAASATSFMEAYCSSAELATFIPLLTTTIASKPGGSVTGTLVSTVTTTLANGQTAGVVNIIYQYGNKYDNSCNGNGGTGNCNSGPVNIKNKARRLLSNLGNVWEVYILSTLFTVIAALAFTL